MQKKRCRSSSPSSKYKPGETEEAIRQRVLRRLASRPAPRMKLTRPGILPKLAPDHPDEFLGNALLMDATGARYPDFLRGTVEHLVGASLEGGQINEKGLNFMLSGVAGFEPRDQAESMLATQITVTHVAIMQSAHRLLHAATIEHRESAERMFSKLTRKFGTLMEALQRYRSGGERKVTIRHVSVRGGQAVVGNVTQSPAELASKEVERQASALVNAWPALMQIIEQDGKPIIVPLQDRSEMHCDHPRRTGSSSSGPFEASSPATIKPASRRR
jgi:hypothetical protein